MELIHTYADKVIVLSEGKMVYEGTPQDLWKEQKIIKESSLQIPYFISKSSSTHRFRGVAKARSFSKKIGAKEVCRPTAGRSYP